MITGKTKEQCTLALRAAFGNPDRACEYLFSGIDLNTLSSAAAGHGAGGMQAMEEMGEDYGDEEGS